MRLHDVAHDGEPETGGTRLAAVLPLHEALEDALALLGGMPGPVSDTLTRTTPFSALAPIVTWPPRGV